MEIKELISYQLLQERNPILFAQVERVCSIVKETINGIAGCYNNYTMHDMGHGIRVAHYMEQLAFGISDSLEAAKQFNDIELALLILSAILHDIGMFIRPEDRAAIKENKIKYADTLTYDGVLKVVGSEDDAIKEIIRITHAMRIEEFLNYDFGEGETIAKILKINNNYDYSADVAQICKAHGKDYKYLESLRTATTKGTYTYNNQYLAVLLRIADFMDLDRQRVPMLWFSIMEIKGFSRGEWEKHFIISNETKLKTYMDNKLKIFFDGESSDAKIHRKYLKYIDELKKELENADSLLNTENSEMKYRLKVSTKIEDNVVTSGFSYSDLRLSLNYSAITELLMGRNIYGDSRLGLREIIQNSIDACKIRREIKIEDVPDPMITISYSKN